jgi:hypothetical protein
MMVNGNVGTGIAVAGAFSLVRFRSVPGKAREIASIFLAMTAGLASAAGYVGIALLFTAVISVIMLVFSLIPIKREREYELHVTIPESLNFNGVLVVGLAGICCKTGGKNQEVGIICAQSNIGIAYIYRK